jgi:hypothetical protein
MTGGESTLSVDALVGLAPEEIIRVVDVLEDMQAAFEASPVVGTTTTFVDDLENLLVGDGMDQGSAQSLIGRLVNPLLP